MVNGRAVCSVCVDIQPTRVSRKALKGGGKVEHLIFSEQLQVERKTFTFDLKENPRGRLLKITEDVGGRRDTIIIPSTGLGDIKQVLEKVIAANQSAEPVQAKGKDE